MEKEQKLKRVSRRSTRLVDSTMKLPLTFLHKKQNINTCLQPQLHPKIRNLQKLYLQSKSNTQIIQNSSYFNHKDGNHHGLFQMMDKKKCFFSGQLQEELVERFLYKIQQQSENCRKKNIYIKLRYNNRIFAFNIKARTCFDLIQYVTFELAKIMISLENNYKNCDNLIGYETINKNQQIDYILSNPNLQIGFLDKLQIKPLFFQKSTLIKRPKINISDFKFIKCLGNGGFSMVYLAKGNFNNKYYAMKLLNKKFIGRQERYSIIENERYILSKLKSPFVTELEFAFQTKNHFIFAIQYCPGGELFHQLRKIKRMKQHDAKFYFLQILIGLDYIHQENIIYRDLKPENLLIGLDGHIKIADFGLSGLTQQKQQECYSFCGSPEYMAPEMLTKSGHNYLLDYYCIGALLYQLIFGVPPYYSLDFQEIYDSILNQQLSFPDHTQISDDLKSLLTGLLQKNYKIRLGSMFGIKEILLHPWVGKICQKSIQNKQLIPPFIPDLKKFNFDTTDIRQEQFIISKKIKEDMLLQDFETYFNQKFYYQRSDFRKNIEQSYIKQKLVKTAASSCDSKNNVVRNTSTKKYFLTSTCRSNQNSSSHSYLSLSKSKSPYNFTNSIIEGSKITRKYNSNRTLTLRNESRKLQY